MCRNSNVSLQAINNSELIILRERRGSSGQERASCFIVQRIDIHGDKFVVSSEAFRRGSRLYTKPYDVIGHAIIEREHISLGMHSMGFPLRSKPFKRDA